MSTEIPEKFKKAPRVVIQADYKFTDSEKLVLGQQLAGLMQKKEEIAAKKKDLVAQMNALEQGCTAEIKGTSNKLHSGFEVRPTECHILFHDPEKGQKSFFALGTLDRVKTEIMLSSDYEQELPMEDLPPAAPPVADAPKKGRGKKAQATEPESQPAAAGAPAVDPSLEEAPTGATSIPTAGTGEEGTTSLSDALQAAAAGKSLPKVAVDLSPDFPADKARATWRKAARKQGWPEAAVDLIDERCLEVMDDADAKGSIKRVLDILQAHSEGVAP